MTIEQMIKRKAELGYSNEKIAQLSGVPVSTVRKIFAGITKQPKYQTILALEVALSPTYTLNETALAYMTKPQGQYTIEDYDQLPEDSFVELIDGVLYDLSGPSVTHQIISTELWMRFKVFIKGKRGPCLPIIAPCDVILRKEDNMTVVQPDVFVVCDKKKIIGGRIEGAVDLAVEVISPSTKRKDYTIKFQKYVEAGTREYWIVDPDKQKVVVYLLENGPDPFIYTFQDIIPVGIFNNECMVNMKEVLDEIEFLYETNEQLT